MRFLLRVIKEMSLTTSFRVFIVAIDGAGGATNVLHCHKKLVCAVNVIHRC